MNDGIKFNDIQLKAIKERQDAAVNLALAQQAGKLAIEMAKNNQNRPQQPEPVKLNRNKMCLQQKSAYITDHGMTAYLNLED